VNNAIVLVDYINQLRDQGEERNTAILTAGATRLRPILMTTLTTVLGLFPMSLGMGDGSELLAPLATVVIGGLLFSTLLTLFFIPVLYSLLDDAGKRLFGIERDAVYPGGDA
jgi:HAE1 family hydrophobic/amphiphilic exporter-1